MAGGGWAYFQYGPIAFGDNEGTVKVSTESNHETRGVETNQVGDDVAEPLSPASLASSVSRIEPSAIADIARIAKQDAQQDKPAIASSELSAESVEAVDSQVMADKAEVQARGDELSVPKTAMLEADDELVATEVNDKVSSLSEKETVVSLPDESASDTQSISDEAEKPRTAMAVKLSDGTNIDDLKLSAKKALAEKETGRAIELLGKVLNEQPDNVNARKQLASLLFANREFGKAEVLLQYGLQLNPEQHDIRLMLARLYQQNERSNDALVLLQKVSPDATLNIDYYNQRASLAQRLNIFMQASEDYRVLANIEPEQAKWWLGLGVSADRLNQSENAILGYTKALSLNQLDSQVTAFMQQRLRGLGR